MLIRLKVDTCGPLGSFKAGDTPDIDRATAEIWIRDGVAEPVEVSRHVGVEKAVVEPKEVAVTIVPKSKHRGRKPTVKK
jgi:hypothetical protein